MQEHTHTHTHTCVYGEEISKVLLIYCVVTPKHENTSTNIHGTVTPPTLRAIATRLSFLPPKCIYMDIDDMVKGGHVVK